MSEDWRSVATHLVSQARDRRLEEALTDLGSGKRLCDLPTA
jgi:hypothetical protein